MGHDISAYIRIKGTQEEEPVEVSYFRISAFDTRRQRVFYNTLAGSEVANGGVSGNGSDIVFSRQDIQNTLDALEYYLDDYASLMELVRKRDSNADEQRERFKKALGSILGQEFENAMTPDENLDDVRESMEDVADAIKFHNDIIFAYDEAQGDREILIHFA